ncbi:hypothetical protein [Nocardia sp. NPDC050710]|uniref:hypothetical protein n=1 Tax=Nocardia sp. NPDC050710 TaxID=3157220 RepID=UPI0033D92197
MADKKEVDPDSLPKAAEAMDGVQSALQSARRRFDAALLPGSMAWGDDKFGAQFAGDFVEACDNMGKGTDDMADRCGQIAGGQRDGARLTKLKEQLTEEEFQRLLRQSE